jgi:N-acetylneuraminic acid mutarotase
MSKKPLLLLLSAVVTIVSGCGGGSSTTTETRNTPQALVISTTSLPNGNVQNSYTATLMTSGGSPPVSWVVSAGALPSGVSLVAATGQILGTPTTAGTYNFTVKATDSGSTAQSTTAPLSITINNPPLRITSLSLPVGAINSTYSATLQASGGKPPLAWRVTTGTLPFGLTLNAASGKISGTATTEGTFTFAVEVSDSDTPAQIVSQPFSITINPPVSITTTTLTNGAVGCGYGATFTSTGGTPPITWSITIGTLPAGLVLDPATGQISGSPTTLATSNFTVQAKDSSTPVQMASEDLSLAVAAATPPGGCWRDTGAMSSARAGHTATLLQDGRVLIAGQGTVTAELYSPANGSWTLTGNMSVGRSGQTATRLNNGKILVAGGSAPDGRFDSSGYTAELYDPVMGTWSLTGSMSVARTGHTAVLLLDGTVLAVGGTSTSPCDPFCAGGHTTELYDPNSGTWSRTHDIMITGRSGGLTATRLNDGRVLVAGGSSGGFPLSNAELYDLGTGTWASTGDMGVARSGHTATLLKNGKVLVVGGQDHCQHDSVDWCVTTASAEVYDPATGTWTRVAQMKTGRFFQTATLLNDGKVLAAGGAGDGFWGPAPFAIAEVYDPVADTWTSTANGNMHSARSNHTATLLNDGKVLVTGGVAEVRWEQSCGDLGCQNYPVFIYSASAEIYDPGP